VTHLRKMMLDELQRRNYSEHTTRYYIRTVEDFARRFNRPPDRVGPRHVRPTSPERDSRGADQVGHLQRWPAHLSAV